MLVTEINESVFLTTIEESAVIETKTMGSCSVLKVMVGGKEVILIQNPICGTYMRVE